MSEPTNPASRLRGFLVLARASNLPTVWSNCLAGWLLAQGAYQLPGASFLLLCAGASLIYIGGMFLNDAFDVAFDQQFRKERPIPSGLISAQTVWICGTAFLVMGLFSLSFFGTNTALLALVLIGMVIAYDALHKKTFFSPILMGACRFLLYLVAAAAAGAVSKGALWSGAVLGLYIVGLSYVAKAESAPGPLRYWPLVFLAAPILSAWIINDWSVASHLWVPAILFIAWTTWSLRCLFRTKAKNIGAAVSGLLAGIVLVDFLALGTLELPVLFTFLVLFVAARLFQKLIPAT